MSRNGMLPSVPENSMLIFLCRATDFRWLKKVSNWFFFTMLMTSTIYHLHHGLGMGHSGPNAISSNTPY